MLNAFEYDDRTDEEYLGWTLAVKFYRKDDGIEDVEITVNDTSIADNEWIYGTYKENYFTPFIDEWLYELKKNALKKGLLEDYV